MRSFESLVRSADEDFRLVRESREQAFAIHDRHSTIAVGKMPLWKLFRLSR
jgi:hypothetical protein